MDAWYSARPLKDVDSGADDKSDAVRSDGDGPRTGAGGKEGCEKAQEDCRAVAMADCV